MGLKKFLRDQDLFASNVKFTFRQLNTSQEYDTTYKTTLGGALSLLCYFIFTVCISVKTKELVDGHGDAQHQMTTTFLDQNVPIDLYKLNYMFALHKIDPRLGRIEVRQVDHKSQGKVSTEIPMVDCRELLPDPDDAELGYLNNPMFNPYRTTFRYEPDFVCPKTDSLVLQGHYALENF